MIFLPGIRFCIFFSFWEVLLSDFSRNSKCFHYKYRQGFFNQWPKRKRFAWIDSSPWKRQLLWCIVILMSEKMKEIQESWVFFLIKFIFFLYYWLDWFQRGPLWKKLSTTNGEFDWRFTDFVSCILMPEESKFTKFPLRYHTNGSRYQKVPNFRKSSILRKVSWRWTHLVPELQIRPIP